MKISDRKKLEEMATQLTGIPVIKDKEYQKLTYQRIDTKTGVIHSQKRSKLFKSTKRFL